MGRNWVFRFSPRPNIQMRRERLFPMQKGKLEGKKIEEDFFPQRFFFFLLEGNRNRERYEYCFAHKSEEGKAKVFLFSGPPKLLFSDFCTFVSLQMFRKYAEEKSAAEERGIFIRKKVVWETLVVCIRFWRKNLCLICLPRLLPLSPLLENELFRLSLIKTGWR